MKKIFLFLSLIILYSVSSGIDYYVSSSSGNDEADGMSPESAWATIDKVNSFNFKPADTINFEGGGIFNGELRFTAEDSGTSTAPVTITSYGSERATIYAGNEYGMRFDAVSGVVIKNINILGSGRETNGGNGINFNCSLSGDIKMDYVYISSVQISGFGNFGIIIGGWNGLSGYKNVTIDSVEIHDVGTGGIGTYGQFLYSNKNFKIVNSKIYNISGIETSQSNTGNGIDISSMDNAVIDGNIIYNVGWLCNVSEGPYGVRVRNSRNVIVQNNESYNNSSSGPTGGGGFSFEVNVSNSILQYNFSHDNGGPGFKLYHYYDDESQANNIIRYNISQNDARKNDCGAIEIYGRNLNTLIYSNTIFLDTSSLSSPVSVKIYGGLIIQNLSFYNNIFCVRDDLELINIDAITLTKVVNLKFIGNAYSTGNGNFVIRWGNINYTSLDDWRTQTGQEKLSWVNTGIYTSNLGLTDPGNALPVNNPELLKNLTYYIPIETSVIVDAGLDLSGIAGIQLPEFDFCYKNIPQGLNYDIGACEYQAGVISNRPSIQITSPAGGEIWKIDYPATITWISSNSFNPVCIDLSINNGLTWMVLVSSTANDGMELISVPNFPSNSCRIRIYEIDTFPTDISDNVFTIEFQPEIEISPSILDFGEVKIGEKKTMTFTIKNKKQGVISGIVESDKEWIIVEPETFSSQEIVINVTVDNKILNKKTDRHTGTISVHSTGGDGTVDVVLNATCVLTRPNPGKIDEGITFFGTGIIPYKTKITIYTINKEKINELFSSVNRYIFWDCRDEKGNPVIPGIYIYTYESPVEKGIGKFILR